MLLSNLLRLLLRHSTVLFGDLAARDRRASAGFLLKLLRLARLAGPDRCGARREILHSYRGNGCFGCRHFAIFIVCTTHLKFSIFDLIRLFKDCERLIAGLFD